MRAQSNQQARRTTRVQHPLPQGPLRPLFTAAARFFVASHTPTPVTTRSLASPPLGLAHTGELTPRQQAAAYTTIGSGRGPFSWSAPRAGPAAAAGARGFPDGRRRYRAPRRRQASRVAMAPRLPPPLPGRRDRKPPPRAL